MLPRKELNYQIPLGGICSSHAHTAYYYNVHFSSGMMRALEYSVCNFSFKETHYIKSKATHLIKVVIIIHVFKFAIFF